MNQPECFIFELDAPNLGANQSLRERALAFMLHTCVKSALESSADWMDAEKIRLICAAYVTVPSEIERACEIILAALDGIGLYDELVAKGQEHKYEDVTCRVEHGLAYLEINWE